MQTFENFSAYFSPMTRSQATELVEFYAEKGNLSRSLFIQETWNMWLNYMGSSREYPENNVTYSTHKKIAKTYYYIILELFSNVKYENHEKKIESICTKFEFDDYDTVNYLNWAVFNHYCGDDEELLVECSNEFMYDDTCIETTTCGVCGFGGEDEFYFSTMHGLNIPVCSLCVSIDDEEDDEDYNPEDEEYIEEEDDEEDDDDEDYNPEDEEYIEEEDDEEDDDDEDYNPEDEEYIEEEDDEDDENDEDYNPEDEEYIEEEDDEDDENDEEYIEEEDEKWFGCEGCKYEWHDGWKNGWKAAMKQIKKFTKEQKKNENIFIPMCDGCGVSQNLKKCSGTCNTNGISNNITRYCSKTCQSNDWKEHKKHCSKQ